MSKKIDENAVEGFEPLARSGDNVDLSQWDNIPGGIDNPSGTDSTGSKDEDAEGGGSEPPKKRGITAGIIVIAIIIIICLLVVVPFIKGKFTQMPVMTETAVVTVSEETPQVRDITSTSRVVGVIESQDSKKIYAKTSGDLLSVNVNEGDSVKEGDIICIIDSDSITSAEISKESALAQYNSAQLSVSNSERNLTDAQTSLSNAEKTLTRYQELYETGTLSLSELENYQNAVTSAQSQVTAAETSLSQAKYSLEQSKLSYDQAVDNYNNIYDNAYVQATISGVIEDLNVDPGDSVNAQTEICTISKKTDMKLVCDVSGTIASSVKVGDSVKITQNGKEINGTISSVNKDADASTGLFEVKVSIPEGKDLASNSKATAYLQTGSSGGFLTIPYNAVYYDSGDPYVYVDKDGSATVTYIETGINDGDYVAVTSGLTSSDSVITSWSNSLSDGTQVQDINDPDVQDAMAAEGAAQGGMPGGGPGGGGAPGGGFPG